MFQKVSVAQLFLFEVWGKQGFLAPAPAAFQSSKEKWHAKGTFGGASFEIEIGEEHAAKDQVGARLPIATANNTDFKITFTRGSETDSVTGTTKFL